MSNENRVPENVGVINPYALAEVTLGRRVSWKQVDSPKLLEQTLEMPYQQLFDPKHESPIYTGLKFNPQTLSMERAEVPPTVAGAPKVLVEVGAEAVWVDPGDFFEEATELTDPVQGALGDCYFIAALSSVAWARTYQIAQRARATATAQQHFVDMIEFYDNGSPVEIEVTELVPMNPPANNFIYARSSEPGEIWPAVYEKAYAKWRTNDPGDRPEYDPIAFGDPVRAAAQLTGLKRHYYWNTDLSADEIYHKVRENCLSRKTFNPMVAWTYSSGDASPDNVNYNDAHLAANHAYSILGWQYANNQKYIVLRNPWGTHEATLNVEGGTWIAWDAPCYGGPGWWRPINMATDDGIFALRADTFKKYFAGCGVVKEH